MDDERIDGSDSPPQDWPSLPPTPSQPTQPRSLLPSPPVNTCCGITFEDRKKYNYHFRCTHRAKQAVYYTHPPARDAEIDRNPVTQHFHCLRCLAHYPDPDSMKRHAKSCVGTVIDETAPSFSTLTTTTPAPNFDVTATFDALSISQAHQKSSSRPQSQSTRRLTQPARASATPSAQASLRSQTHHQTPPQTTQPTYAPTPPTPRSHSASLDPHHHVSQLRDDDSYIPPKDLDDTLLAIRASIVPDENTVVSHARYDFDKLGIVINTLHKVVICVTCERSLALSTLAAHIKTHGDNITVLRRMAEDLRAEYDLPKVDVARIPEVTGVIAPIFGLQLLDNVYAFCGRCRKGYLDNNGRGMINHHTLCPRHRDDPPDTKGYAQSFAAGRLVAYFQVDPSLIPSRVAPLDAYNLYINSIPVEDHANQPIRSPLDSHNLSQFLHREHWVDHVANSTPSDLRALIAKPEKDDLLSQLKPHVLEYMRVVQVLIPSHDSFGILQEMAQITDAHSLAAFKLVEPSTLDNYSGVLLGILCFVIRAVLGWDCTTYAMHPTAEQSHLVTLLHQALTTAADSTVFQHLIHALSFSLFSQMPTKPEEDKYFSPVIRYLVIASLTDQGHWHHAGAITHIIAAATYCIRSTIFYEMNVLMHKRKVRMPIVFPEVSKYLQSHHETVMAYFYNINRLLCAVRGSEEGFSSVSFTDAAGRQLAWKGDVISLNDITSMIRGLHTEYREIVNEEIFFGLQDLPTLIPIYDISTLVDDLNNHAPGYCFLDDVRNPFNTMKGNLLHLLLNHPKLRGRFHYMHGDKIVWRPGPCRKFLASAQRARQILLLLIMLTYGNPARLTEFCLYTLRNIQGGSIRNFMILFHVICLVGGYTKTAHHTLRDKVIPRAPPLFVIRELVQNLTIIRFVEECFVRDLRTTEDLHRFHYYMWPGASHNITSDQASDWLGMATQRYLKVRITARPYRQIQSSFSHFHRDPQSYDTHKQYWDDYQRAHHSETSNRHYGLNKEMLSNANQTKHIGCIKASGHWHELVNVGQDDPLPLLDGEELPLHVPNHPNTTRTVSGPSTTMTPMDINRLGLNLVDQMTPTLNGMLNRAFSQAFLRYAPAPPPHQPSVLRQRSRIIVHPSRLQDLRDFLKNQKANFKFPEQAELIEYMQRRLDNLLVIFPCGGGKTFMILFQVKMYEEDKVTVIVLPLNALHNDLLRRCSEFEVSCSRWDPYSNPTPSTSLVLVSVEHAVHIGFYNFCEVLAQLARLARLVFDECHLIVCDAPYRDAFNHLKPLRRLAVPFVLFDGTVAPFHEALLMESLEVTSLTVLRMPTMRPEIAYSIHPTPLKDIPDAIAQFILPLIETFADDERAIVFVRSRSQTIEMSVKLGCKAFHATMDLELREEMNKSFKDWVEGITKIIVSTTSLGNGIDLSGVRYAIHFDLPYDTPGLSQQTGRVGRDGLPSYARIYFDPTKPPRTQSTGVDLGHDLLFAWAIDTKLCRRISPWLFLDGVAETCVSLGAQLCDNCTRQLTERPPSSVEMMPSNPYTNKHASTAQLPRQAPFTVTPTPAPPAQPVFGPAPQQRTPPDSTTALRRDTQAPLLRAPPRPLPPGTSPDVFSAGFNANVAGPSKSTASVDQFSGEKAIETPQYIYTTERNPLFYVLNAHSKVIPPPDSERMDIDYLPPPDPLSPGPEPVRAPAPPPVLAPPPGPVPRPVRQPQPLAATGVAVHMDSLRARQTALDEQQRRRTVIDALILLREKCPACWAAGLTTWEDHILDHCPERSASGPDYRNWRGFNPPPGYCWPCCIPQVGKSFEPPINGWHRWQPRANQECPDRDIIKPAIWILLKGKAQGLTWPGPALSTYSASHTWLLTTSTHPWLNLHETFLWLVQQRQLVPS